VFDTSRHRSGALAAQHLEAMGITHFTIVTSHWHNDHIAATSLQDSPILMTARGSSS